MNLYLSKFVQQINNLFKDGISLTHNGTEYIMKFCTLSFPIDTVCRPIVQNRLQFNAYCGCSWCEQLGFYVKAVHGIRYLRNQESIHRCHENPLQYIKEAEDMRTTRKGVKGYSAILELPHMDIVWSFPFEYMHGLLLGVQINSFYNDGISLTHNGTEYIMKFCTLSFPIDTVCRPIAQNRLQINVYCGCSWCEQLSFYVKAVYGIRFYEIKKYIKEAEDMRTTRKGVKGYSAILELPHMDIVWSFPFEYMHGLLLGVVWQLMNIWKKTDCLYGVGAMTFNVHGSIKPKASELKSWSLYFALPCLRGFLEETALQHFALLVRCAFTLLKSDISSLELNQCEEDLTLFVLKFQDLYGEGAMTFNVHALMHCVESVRKTGPLSKNSAFPYESFIYTLKKVINGPKGMDIQIARKHLQSIIFKCNSKEMLNASEDTANYCFNMFTPRRMSKYYDEIKDVTFCGKGIFEHEEVGECIAYNKYIFKGEKKTDDSYIQLRNDQFCRILKILHCGNNCILKLKSIPIHSNDPFHGVRHIKQLKNEDCNNIIFTDINYVNSKVMVIIIENAIYSISTVYRLNKQINNERARAVLKNIENNFEVTQFVDIGENDVVKDGTSSAIKQVVVCLQKVEYACNQQSTVQSSPLKSQSLLASRKRKLVQSSESNTPKSSRKFRFRSRVPRPKQVLSQSSSESDAEQQKSSRTNVLPNQVQSAVLSLSPRKSPTRTRSSSPNSSPTSGNKSPSEGATSLLRQSFEGATSPLHQSSEGATSPLHQSLERTPSMRQSLQHSPRYQHQSTQAQHVANQQQPLFENKEQLLFENVEEPLLENDPQLQNGSRPRCIKYYKMTEYVQYCVDYYDKKEEPGYKEGVLGEGVLVNLLHWELRQTHKPQIFLVELALLIWGETNLCNRALDLTRGVKNIPNRSPRKLIEKDLLRLLINMTGLYNDFLKRQKYPTEEKVSYLLKATYVLRHKISDIHTSEKNKFEKQVIDAQRRLRCNVKD
ncbi:hypothetical protein TSAR_016289 [Trichomalopsis sarcophagae]|uniref:Uncharacterized protein n=1 Tax=Trichomalopsis sarcophagae TaxID=543379 RepID=A0A232EKI1_9HYME|nr:hypothetical protein TSAR_016289 [Trichomalopsis sarcophagae]